MDFEERFKRIGSTDAVKKLILGELDRPAVFKGMIDQWQCRRWTLGDWANQFDNKKIMFRIGPVRRPPNSGPLWETQCDYIHSTIKDFELWLSNINKTKSTSTPNNARHLLDIDPSTYWAYADYKHMAELFDEGHEIHDCLDWGAFGFEGRKGTRSTIWIGSPHSCTPCHYDTYGCNLVAQLIGRKRWVLFAPSDTDNLYPTRIPYEESSVFSQVNITNPNIEHLPRFKLVKPYVVTLEEGDVLFVPPKWWHFVSSLTTSVSINSWIELESDDERRLEEAVTRAVVSAYISIYGVDNPEWLNPTEECVSPETNIQYVNESLKKCVTDLIQEEATQSSGACCSKTQVDKVQSCCSKDEDGQAELCLHRISSQPQVPKKLKTESNEDHHYYHSLTLLKPMSYGDFAQTLCASESFSVTEHETTEDYESVMCQNSDCDFKIKLLNSLVSPDVISLISKKLKNLP